MTASLLLAWGDATRFALVLVAMVVLTAALAVAASLRRTLVPWLVAAFFAAFTIVLAVDPELNSLGVFGARPDGGGRFYGIGNQLETLLLPPVLVAAAIAGLRGLLPLAALALVTIGWSKAGADGGGLVVFATAFAVLGLRLRGLALTPKRLALVAVAVVALTFALVGLDAAFGGSSHVTHAVGTGPGSLLGDLGHRLHLSWAIATNKWYRILIFLGCLAVLVLMGTIRPRRATVDAMLAGLAVSLLVNDTPVDVIGLGALGCLALVRWESVNSRPMRRGALTTVTAVAAALTVLLLAGCGKEGVTQPLPGTVVGTVQAAAPGKAIFIAQGCGSCHTYKPAGPDAQGTIGPDLDKLAQFAKAAKQPEAQFVHDSIVDPEKYTEKGFPEGRHAEVLQRPARERSQGARRLPDETAGLKLPQRLSARARRDRVRSRPDADRRGHGPAAADARGDHRGPHRRHSRRTRHRAHVPVGAQVRARGGNRRSGRLLPGRGRRGTRQRTLAAPRSDSTRARARGDRRAQRGRLRPQLLRRRRALRRRGDRGGETLCRLPAHRAAPGR